MRNIWRDPGAEVLVGLLSFAVSFIAIGLALIAVKLVCYGYWAFVISVLLFIIAGIAIISLFRHEAKTKRYIRQIGIYLRQGFCLRKMLLSVKPESEFTEAEKKANKWEEEVQTWLDDNLPDYAPDFGLETFRGEMTVPSPNESVLPEARILARRLEGKLGNLRQIKRDFRM